MMNNPLSPEGPRKKPWAFSPSFDPVKRAEAVEKRIEKRKQQRKRGESKPLLIFPKQLSNDAALLRRVKEGVSAIPYDAKESSLKQLLRNIRLALGSSKAKQVTFINEQVIPWQLLENQQEGENKTDQMQFWSKLALLLDANKSVDILSPSPLQEKGDEGLAFTHAASLQGKRNRFPTEQYFDAASTDIDEKAVQPFPPWIAHCMEKSGRWKTMQNSLAHLAPLFEVPDQQNRVKEKKALLFPQDKIDAEWIASHKEEDAQIIGYDWQKSSLKELEQLIDEAKKDHRLSSLAFLLPKAMITNLQRFPVTSKEDFIHPSEEDNAFDSALFDHKQMLFWHRIAKKMEYRGNLHFLASDLSSQDMLPIQNLFTGVLSGKESHPHDLQIDFTKTAPQSEAIGSFFEVKKVIEKPKSEKPAKKLLVISSRVDDAETLQLAAKEDVSVLRYDWEKESLDELAQKIARRSGGGVFESIAFANHGKEGEFDLTRDARVSSKTMESDAKLQQFWKEVSKHVSHEGRIDLLACQLAGSIAGEKVVEMLEQQTGRNVAASTNMTANKIENGDWLLETDGINAADDYFNKEVLALWQEKLYDDYYNPEDKIDKIVGISPGRDHYNVFSVEENKFGYATPNRVVDTTFDDEVITNSFEKQFEDVEYQIERLIPRSFAWRHGGDTGAVKGMYDVHFLKEDTMVVDNRNQRNRSFTLPTDSSGSDADKIDNYLKLGFRFEAMDGQDHHIGGEKTELKGETEGVNSKFDDLIYYFLPRASNDEQHRSTACNDTFHKKDGFMAMFDFATFKMQAQQIGFFDANTDITFYISERKKITDGRFDQLLEAQGGNRENPSRDDIRKSARENAFFSNLLDKEIVVNNEPIRFRDYIAKANFDLTTAINAMKKEIADSLTFDSETPHTYVDRQEIEGGDRIDVDRTDSGVYRLETPDYVKADADQKFDKDHPPEFYPYYSYYRGAYKDGGDKNRRDQSGVDDEIGLRGVENSGFVIKYSDLVDDAEQVSENDLTKEEKLIHYMINRSGADDIAIKINPYQHDEGVFYISIREPEERLRYVSGTSGWGVEDYIEDFSNRDPDYKNKPGSDQLDDNKVMKGELAIKKIFYDPNLPEMEPHDGNMLHGGSLLLDVRHFPLSDYDRIQQRTFESEETEQQVKTALENMGYVQESYWKKFTEQWNDDYTFHILTPKESGDELQNSSPSSGITLSNEATYASLDGLGQFVKVTDEREDILGHDVDNVTFSWTDLANPIYDNGEEARPDGAGSIEFRTNEEAFKNPSFGILKGVSEQMGQWASYPGHVLNDLSKTFLMPVDQVDASGESTLINTLSDLLVRYSDENLVSEMNLLSHQFYRVQKEMELAKIHFNKAVESLEQEQDPAIRHLLEARNEMQRKGLIHERVFARNNSYDTGEKLPENHPLLALPPAHPLRFLSDDHFLLPFGPEEVVSPGQLLPDSYAGDVDAKTKETLAIINIDKETFVHNGDTYNVIDHLPFPPEYTEEDKERKIAQARALFRFPEHGKEDIAFEYESGDGGRTVLIPTGLTATDGDGIGYDIDPDFQSGIEENDPTLFRRLQEEAVQEWVPISKELLPLNHPLQRLPEGHPLLKIPKTSELNFWMSDFLEEKKLIENESWSTFLPLNHPWHTFDGGFATYPAAEEIYADETLAIPDELGWRDIDKTLIPPGHVLSKLPEGHPWLKLPEDSPFFEELDDNILFNINKMIDKAENLERQFAEWTKEKRFITNLQSIKEGIDAGTVSKEKILSQIEPLARMVSQIERFSEDLNKVIDPLYRISVPMKVTNSGDAKVIDDVFDEEEAKKNSRIFNESDIFVWSIDAKEPNVHLDLPPAIVPSKENVEDPLNQLRNIEKDRVWVISNDGDINNPYTTASTNSFPSINQAPYLLASDKGTLVNGVAGKELHPEAFSAVDHITDNGETKAPKKVLAGDPYAGITQTQESGEMVYHITAISGHDTLQTMEENASAWKIYRRREDAIDPSSDDVKNADNWERLRPGDTFTQKEINNHNIAIQGGHEPTLPQEAKALAIPAFYFYTSFPKSNNATAPSTFVRPFYVKRMGNSTPPYKMEGTTEMMTGYLFDKELNSDGTPSTETSDIAAAFPLTRQTSEYRDPDDASAFVTYRLRDLPKDENGDPQGRFVRLVGETNGKSWQDLLEVQQVEEIGVVGEYEVLTPYPGKAEERNDAYWGLKSGKATYEFSQQEINDGKIWYVLSSQEKNEVIETSRSENLAFNSELIFAISDKIQVNEMDLVSEPSRDPNEYRYEYLETESDGSGYYRVYSNPDDLLTNRLWLNTSYQFAAGDPIITEDFSDDIAGKKELVWDLTVRPQIAANPSGVDAVVFFESPSMKVLYDADAKKFGFQYYYDDNGTEKWSETQYSNAITDHLQYHQLYLEWNGHTQEFVFSINALNDSIQAQGTPFSAPGELATTGTTITIGSDALEENALLEIQDIRLFEKNPANLAENNTLLSIDDTYRFRVASNPIELDGIDLREKPKLTWEMTAEPETTRLGETMSEEQTLFASNSLKILYNSTSSQFGFQYKKNGEWEEEMTDAVSNPYQPHTLKLEWDENRETITFSVDDQQSTFAFSPSGIIKNGSNSSIFIGNNAEQDGGFVGQISNVFLTEEKNYRYVSLSEIKAEESNFTIQETILKSNNPNAEYANFDLSGKNQVHLNFTLNLSGEASEQEYLVDSPWITAVLDRSDGNEKKQLIVTPTGEESTTIDIDDANSDISKYAIAIDWNAAEKQIKIDINGQLETIALVNDEIAGGEGMLRLGHKSGNSHLLSGDIESITLEVDKQTSYDQYVRLYQNATSPASPFYVDHSVTSADGERHLHLYNGLKLDVQMGTIDSLIASDPDHQPIQFDGNSKLKEIKIPGQASKWVKPYGDHLEILNAKEIFKNGEEQSDFSQGAVELFFKHNPEEPADDEEDNAIEQVLFSFAEQNFVDDPEPPAKKSATYLVYNSITHEVYLKKWVRELNKPDVLYATEGGMGEKNITLFDADSPSSVHTWHHLSFSWENGENDHEKGKITLFLDGNKVGELESEGRAVFDSEKEVNRWTNAITFGAVEQDKHFKGWMKDLRIWTKARKNEGLLPLYLPTTGIETDLAVSIRGDGVGEANRSRLLENSSERRIFTVQEDIPAMTLDSQTWKEKQALLTTDTIVVAPKEGSELPSIDATHFLKIKADKEDYDYHEKRYSITSFDSETNTITLDEEIKTWPYLREMEIQLYDAAGQLVSSDIQLASEGNEAKMEILIREGDTEIAVSTEPGLEELEEGTVITLSPTDPQQYVLERTALFDQGKSILEISPAAKKPLLASRVHIQVIQEESESHLARENFGVFISNLNVDQLPVSISDIRLNVDNHRYKLEDLGPDFVPDTGDYLAYAFAYIMKAKQLHQQQILVKDENGTYYESDGQSNPSAEVRAIEEVSQQLLFIRERLVEYQQYVDQGIPHDADLLFLHEALNNLSSGLRIYPYGAHLEGFYNNPLILQSMENTLRMLETYLIKKQKIQKVARPSLQNMLLTEFWRSGEAVLHSSLSTLDERLEKVQEGSFLLAQLENVLGATLSSFAYDTGGIETYIEKEIKRMAGGRVAKAYYTAKEEKAGGEYEKYHFDPSVNGLKKSIIEGSNAYSHYTQIAEGTGDIQFDSISDPIRPFLRTYADPHEVVFSKRTTGSYSAQSAVSPITDIDLENANLFKFTSRVVFEGDESSSADQAIWFDDQQISVLYNPAAKQLKFNFAGGQGALDNVTLEKGEIYDIDIEFNGNKADERISIKVTDKNGNLNETTYGPTIRELTANPNPTDTTGAYLGGRDDNRFIGKIGPVELQASYHRNGQRFAAIDDVNEQLTLDGKTPITDEVKEKIEEAYPNQERYILLQDASKYANSSDFKEKQVTLNLDNYVLRLYRKNYKDEEVELEALSSVSEEEAFVMLEKHFGTFQKLFDKMDDDGKIVEKGLVSQIEDLLTRLNPENREEKILYTALKPVWENLLNVNYQNYAATQQHEEGYLYNSQGWDGDGFGVASVTRVLNRIFGKVGPYIYDDSAVTQEDNENTQYQSDLAYNDSENPSEQKNRQMNFTRINEAFRSQVADAVSAFRTETDTIKEEIKKMTVIFEEFVRSAISLNDELYESMLDVIRKSGGS